MAVPVVHTTLTTDRVINEAVPNVGQQSLGNPTNTAVGDLLVAVVFFQNGGGTRTCTPSAGWTAISPLPTSGDAGVRVHYMFVYPIPDSTALANLPATHTFTTSEAPGRAAATIFRVTGADLVDFTDGVGAWSPSTGQVSSTAPAFTSTDNQSLVLITSATNNSPGIGAPVATSSTATIFTSISSPPNATTATSTSTLHVAYTQAVDGINQAQTISYSPSATNSASFQLALRSASPTPAAPEVTRSVQGLPTHDLIRANTRVVNTTSVAMVASTSPDMSNPIIGTGVAPDSEGYADVTVNSLAANTDYYWQISLDGVLSGTINMARTLITPGTVHSHAIVFGSCMHKAASQPVFDEMRTRTFGGKPAALLVHLGDLHYEWASYQTTSVAPNDQAAIRNAYEASLTSIKFNELVRNIPMSHTWSDNDFCGSNSDSTYAARPAAIAARRQTLSDPALPSTEGLYRSWVIGRVRYIQTDSRAFMMQRSLPDDASKSMLGATQKQWLKDELLAAKNNNQAVIWFHDQIWKAGTTTPTATNDTWGVFNTERTELGNFITSNELTDRIFYASGDIHTLAADDGTNNTWGGFAAVTASPFYQSANGLSGNWSEGGYPGVGTGSTPNQSFYGWLEIDDTGADTIAVTYRGFDATLGTSTERIAMTVPLRVARSTVAVWDGANEIPATVAIWDGTSEIASSPEVAQ